MISFNLYALCHRFWLRLTGFHPLILSLVGVAIFIGIVVAMARFGWPPREMGAWRVVSPLIAIAAPIGWLALVLAFIRTPMPAAWPGAPGSAPRPSSYRDMLLWSLRVSVRHIVGYGLAGAGLLIVPAAIFDLAELVLTGIIPDLPWYSITAHNLYAIALLLTEPRLLGFVGVLVLLAITACLGWRFLPARWQDMEYMRLASVGNPTVRAYREELNRLGRRMLREDADRLSTEIMLNRLAKT